MAKSTDIPVFGPLHGLKVVHCSQSVAGPFAAALMADMGADVIWAESAVGQDVSRIAPGMAAQLDRRNMRTISLNVSTPQGHEILLSLLRDADIFIEASRPGQYEKWGLTDDVLWQTNPALVITHISGFGQYGDGDYIRRASYDPIAQAFSGLMYMNGFPGRRSSPAEVSVSDYYTGYMAAFASLAAYVNAKKTGKGESIDVSQYESTLRCQSGWPLDMWNDSGRVFTQGKGNNSNVGFNSYMCNDGQEIYMVIIGSALLKKLMALLGLPYNEGVFAGCINNVKEDTEAGRVLEKAITDFCAARSSEEAEAAFVAAGLPCSRILRHGDMLSHPHYIARESITKWERVDGTEIIGQNVTPKLKNNPGQIWRGCPTVGMDNEDILREAGFDEEYIRSCYEDGTITKK